MPRRLKAIPNDIEGAAARKLEAEAPPVKLEAAPTLEARRKRAQSARVKTEQARAEEHAETEEALGRIKEQMKTVEKAAGRVPELAEFKKKLKSKARPMSLPELNEAGAALGRIQEQLKTSEDAAKAPANASEAAENVIDLAEFREKTEVKARGEEHAEAGEALGRIQEQLKTVEDAGENVIDLAEFRKKKAKTHPISLTELEEPFAPEHLAKEERVLRPARERAAEAPETDAELQKHQALAEAGRIRARLARRAVEKGELTEKNFWESVHQLRSRESQLEDALSDAFDRPYELLETKIYQDERRALLAAFEEVQNALEALRSWRSKVEERHAQARFEQNYAEAKQKAFDAYKPDLERTRDIREDLAAGKLPKEQRGRYLDFFQSRVKTLESELEGLDKLPAEEASKFENAAAYEAVSETIKDLRGTIQDLLQAEQGEQEKVEREVSRDERLKTYFTSVDKVLGNLFEVMRLDRMTEEWREQALLELSKTYADLEDELRYFQTQAPNDKSTLDTRNQIADYLERINETRRRLHALRLGEVQEDSVALKKIKTLDKELKSKKREIRNLEREAAPLAEEVKRLYGRAPEEILAQGDDVGGFFKGLKRLAARLTGQDAYGEWKAKMNRIEELSRDLGPTLTERPMGPEESLAKLPVTPEQREMETKRIGERSAARGYREMPKTEEEFFDGTFEEPAEVLPTEEQRRIAESLDESGRRGVENASLIYRDIAENPAAELLSFGPEEYVRKLAIVQEAKEAQDKTKGRARFAAKKRLKAESSALAKMQNELRENGINVETGLGQRTDRAR